MTVDLQRRSFFKTSAIASGGLVAGTFAASPLKTAVAAAVNDMEVMTWSGCAVNCGSRCQLRVFTKHGRIIRIETDDSNDPAATVLNGGCTQIRACQRGRSMRKRI